MKKPHRNSPGQNFTEEVKARVLLWCDRHCCYCDKACGVDIEIDHLKPRTSGGTSDIDNAYPVCYDCHAKLQRYDPIHRRGTKYRLNERKVRRDQIYEKYTRHLVPPVNYFVTQTINPTQKRQFPDVGFVLQHLGDSLPVRVKIALSVKFGERTLPRFKGYYNGEKFWRLNPRLTYHGHFSLPSAVVNSQAKIEITVRLSIIDAFEREHHFLPIGFIYMRNENDWYLEP
jgi:HNH endonuclease